MKCPNNDECEIGFTSIDWDNGDPSTPYFESGFSFVYDESNSFHVPGCTLTEKQIEELETEYNNDSYYDYESYYFEEF